MVLQQEQQQGLTRGSSLLIRNDAANNELNVPCVLRASVVNT
jgi:hypothetical protein